MTWIYDGPESVSAEGQHFVTFTGGPLHGQTHGRASKGPYYVYQDAENNQSVYESSGLFIGSEIPVEAEWKYDPEADFDLVRSLVGTKIVYARVNYGDDGASDLTLWFDDGRVIEISPQGYDGPTLSIELK